MEKNYQFEYRADVRNSDNKHIDKVSGQIGVPNESEAKRIIEGRYKERLVRITSLKQL